MAVTGDFWNLDNPEKPWGPFDPDAEIVFPIDVTKWLASLAAPYADHLVIAPAPLEDVGSQHSAGIIQIRLRVASGAAYKPGVKYPFTVRVICADGQHDDRTLFLKVKPR